MPRGSCFPQRGAESRCSTLPSNHELRRHAHASVPVGTKPNLTAWRWEGLRASCALRASLRGTRCSAIGIEVPVGASVGTAGLEPATPGSRSRCADQTALRSVVWRFPRHGVEPEPRVELGSSGYEAAALPLSYSGIAGDRRIELRTGWFGGTSGPSPSPVVGMERLALPLPAYETGALLLDYIPVRGLLTLEVEWTRRESNSLPPVYQTGALTNELHVPNPCPARDSNSHPSASQADAHPLSFQGMMMDPPTTLPSARQLLAVTMSPRRSYSSPADPSWTGNQSFPVSMRSLCSCQCASLRTVANSPARPSGLTVGSSRGQQKSRLAGGFASHRGLRSR